jgi:coproporphyrinogen III oxidase
LDGNVRFQSDSWERAEGGGGRTNTILNGKIIEKGGVAFSAVHGPVSQVMKQQLGLDGDAFFATGISIVIHPFSPHVPIIHMNIRYFELDNGTYWFGGGIDLTPHYVVPENARVFHERLKSICDKHSNLRVKIEKRRKAIRPRFKYDCWWRQRARCIEINKIISRLISYH